MFEPERIVTVKADKSRSSDLLPQVKPQKAWALVNYLISIKGGRVISSHSLSGKDPILFKLQCKNGHEMNLSLFDLKRGYWCSKCKCAHMRIPLSKLGTYAQSRGGKLLSEAHPLEGNIFEWECARGHRWKAAYNIIYTKTWCIECWEIDKKKTTRAKKFSIEFMQLLALKRGGQCLSEAYLGTLTKLRWRCAEGHEWEALPHHIVRRSWCRICSRKNMKPRFTILDMRGRAAKFGGTCLSSEYKGSKIALLWQCAEGHQWSAVPSTIVCGLWCSKCRRKQKRDNLLMSI